LARQRGPKFVAVPFIGTGAGERLPLAKGDLLVTKIDESAVKAGLIKPDEVSDYIKKGVEVHHVKNLHAKVFVFPEMVVVGSTNLSASSELHLLEAALLTNHPKIRSDCEAFVCSLRGDLVGLEFTNKLRRLYRPPRGIFGQLKKSRQPEPVLQSELWAVKLVEEPRTRFESEQVHKGRLAASRHIKNTKFFALEDFLWPRDGFLKRLKLGDRLLQCTYQTNGGLLLSPPGRVISIRSYSGIRGGKHAVVCLEVPLGQKPKGLKDAMRRLGSAGRVLDSDAWVIRIKDVALVQKIGQLWPSVKQL
jgi:hypothetical protein